MKSLVRINNFHNMSIFWKSFNFCATDWFSGNNTLYRLEIFWKKLRVFLINLDSLRSCLWLTVCMTQYFVCSSILSKTVWTLDYQWFENIVARSNYL